MGEGARRKRRRGKRTSTIKLKGRRTAIIRVLNLTDWRQGVLIELPEGCVFQVERN